MLITQSGAPVFALSVRLERNICLECFCFEIIVTDYIKCSAFHQLALTCCYENVFIKCSLSCSVKEEAIIILFGGIRYLVPAMKYDFNMQAY